jgi:hypothetical protein
MIEMKRYFVVYLFIAFLIGCGPDADPLTLDRIEFNSNAIKIQGYYYNCDTEYCYPFYLFKNGVYLSCGSLEIIKKNRIDSIITNVEFIKRLKNTQYGWGVFQANGNLIKIESWLSGNGGPYPTRLLSGKIINDTIITISGYKSFTDVNKIDTFHFRYLVEKPDSTNMFIK